MLTTLLQLILNSLISGIIGDVFVRIITQEDHVLGWYRKLLEMVAQKYLGPEPDIEKPSGKCYKPASIFEPIVDPECFEEIRRREADFIKANDAYNKKLDKVDYILKPILNCIYCVSGQIGLWSSVYFVWKTVGAYHLSDIPYSIFTALVAVYFGGLAQVVQRKLFPVNE